MHATIAVVFDFDDTLAPDTTSGLLRASGLDDVAGFWRDEVDALHAQGWDPVPAYLHALVRAQNAGRIAPLTREALQAWGARAPLHDGVDTLFARLRTAAESVNPRARLEFFVISSGLGDVIRATPIAHQFTDIWASDFHYDDVGRAAFPRRVVSFTDKTRYLFHIQKGLVGPAHASRPFEVNRKVAREQQHVPMDQMIFVGDGFTDIPCFSLLRQHKGIPIAVYDREREERWGRAFRFVLDERVSNLHSARYTPDSDLSNFLVMAVRALAERIALAEHTYQG